MLMAAVGSHEDQREGFPMGKAQLGDVRPRERLLFRHLADVFVKISC